MKEKVIVLDDGFRVGVLEGGEGLHVVFLHGLTVRARAYIELLESLERQGCRVIALDAVDHGDTDALPCGYSVEDMIDVTARALDQLGVDRAVLVGHSMGGGMVVEFAAKYPHRVLHAILIDAAAGGPHHENMGVRPVTPLWAVQKIAGAVADVVGDALHAVRLRDAKESLSLLDTLRGSVNGFRWVRAAYALAHANTVPLLKKLRFDGTPTTVVHGLKDHIIPVEAGIDAAWHSAARLHLIRDAYHSWLLADPEMAANIILSEIEWIEGGEAA